MFEIKYGQRNIDRWLAQHGNREWDLIHFNFGLHDIKHFDSNNEFASPENGGVIRTNEEDYEDNLQRLVDIMRQRSRRLVWRNTTPIPEGVIGRYPRHVQKYNEIASRVMDRNGVPTLDLYTPSVNNMSEWMKVADVHYHPVGYQALAEIVSNDILEQLNTPAQP